MNNWFAAAAAGVLAFIGFSGDRMATQTPNFTQGSSTHKEQVDHRSASSTKPVINISCVSSAVSVRETSIDAAEATFTAAMNSAYSARASALASAYALSDNDAIRSAVKAAWKQFTTTSKGTRSAWQKAKENTWQTFRTAIKACGPSASVVSDSENASSEMSGQ